MDFRHYRRPSILRSIHSRMAMVKVDSLTEYARVLRANPAEVDLLLERMLIKTTAFFRDPDNFHALDRQAIVPLIRHLEGTFLRVWSVGCSFGEEPYSVAMLLLEVAERLKKTVRFQILASDVSPMALGRARKGVYSERAMAGVSPERRARFFTSVPDGYRIHPSIRRSCIFTEHNLVDSIPFSRMDLITCRNVLIYMGPDLQRIALERLHFALRPGGYLMLGSAEDLQGQPGWRAVDRTHRLFQRAW